MSYDKGFRAGLTFSAKKARESSLAALNQGASSKWQAVAVALDELAKVLDEAATPEPPADPLTPTPNSPTLAPASAVAA